MKNDAAFMQPVGDELDFDGGWRHLGARLGKRRFGIGDEPEMAAVSKFFREVSEDVGEDLTFAALGAADAGEPDPRLRLRSGA
jgi:hypothetical protein